MRDSTTLLTQLFVVHKSRKSLVSADREREQSLYILSLARAYPFHCDDHARLFSGQAVVTSKQQKAEKN